MQPLCCNKGFVLAEHQEKSVSDSICSMKFKESKVTSFNTEVDRKSTFLIEFLIMSTMTRILVSDMHVTVATGATYNNLDRRSTLILQLRHPVNGEYIYHTMKDIFYPLILVTVDDYQSLDADKNNKETI